MLEVLVAAMTLEFDKKHTKNNKKKNSKNIIKVFHTSKQQIVRIKKVWN